jgi:hypothetical protein
MSAVELKGGLLVDERAIALAIALNAGHVLSVRDGALLVTNGSGLSAEQRQQITAWKRHLCAIAAYDADEMGRAGQVR